MTQVDTSLYNALLRPPKSVADYDNEALATQQNRLLVQSGQAKLQEQQRGLQQENALANAFRAAVGADGSLNRNKLYTQAVQDGLGARLPAIQKEFADQDKVVAETDDKRASTKRAGREDAAHQFEIAGQMVGAWSTNPGVTKQQIISGLNAAMRTNVINDAVAQAKINELAGIGDDPASLNGWAKQTLMQVLKAKDQFALTDPDANTVANNRQSDTNSRRSADSSRYSADSSARSAAVGHRLKADENRINMAGIVGKRLQDVELKLQDDYRTESKGFGETSGAMKKILSAIGTADKNPGSALSAGTSFMKLLDPNSVVRESELGMALNASGWFDRATNIAATLKAGKIMTPTQQKNLRAAAEDLFEEAKAAQREVDAAFKKRAVDYGADPARVIVDRGQNTGRASAAALPPRNKDGWELLTDKHGNKAYVSPDGKQFKEVN